MNRAVRAAAFLSAIAVGQAQNAGADKPQYYDQPAFIVAGVADNTNRGGHGSGVVLRSAEALTKATAAMSSSSTSLDTAQSLRDSLERDPNNAGLHHSLADVEEKLGHPLDALREYQRAAELASTETNLFDLGTELLTHLAPQQAVEVFSRGAGLFPRSSRMLLGLAAALYSKGSYDEAAKRFFEATDLDPGDPQPYLFLGNVRGSSIAESVDFAARMERFAKLHPENAWANYYYAVSLSSRSSGTDDTAARSKSVALLEKAVQLDSHLGVAWLQLGILYSDANEFAEAISAWQNAVTADPQLGEPHYRLAQAYRKTGETTKAQQEISLYEQLSKQSAEELERRRAAVKKFVFALRGQPR